MNGLCRFIVEVKRTLQKESHKRTLAPVGGTLAPVELEPVGATLAPVEIGNLIYRGRLLTPEGSHVCRKTMEHNCSDPSGVEHS